MPTLYQHQTEFHYYILTSINSHVVTFRVTTAGVSKLRAAGINVGQRFPRRLLFALYRDGDLSTTSSGQLDSSAHADSQVEFDFAEDLTGSSEFPVCDCCSGVLKLSLVVVTNGQHLAGEITCLQCYNNYGLDSDFRTPLPIQSSNLADTLLYLNKLLRRTPNTTKLEHILHRVP